MDRFIIKKHKLDDDRDASVAGSAVSVSFKTIMCCCNKDYFSFGFISSGEEQPCPKCIFLVRKWQTKL